MIDKGYRSIRVLFFLLIPIFFSSCSGLFFFPEKNLVLTPSTAKLEYRSIPVTTADGLQLDGWLLAGAPPVKGTIVYMHGNAQNISYHLAAVHWLPEEHYNVYLYDYRGFGESQGKPTIESSIADYADVMATLENALPEEQQKYIVFGQSLGGAFAIAAVAKYQHEFPIDLLVIDSAFSGFRRIAKEKLKSFWLTRPIRSLLGLTITNEPDLLQEVALISPTPIIFIQGMEDQVVPSHHSKNLFKAAKQPKELWLEPDAEHTQSLLHKELRDRFVKALDSYTGKNQSSAQY